MEEHLLPCLFKKYLGIECLGCGIQRSFLALVKGDLMESIQLYPALIPMLITFAILFVHLKYKLKHGPRILVFAFSITSALILGNYLIKLFYP